MRRLHERQDEHEPARREVDRGREPRAGPDREERRQQRPEEARLDEGLPEREARAGERQRGTEGEELGLRERRAPEAGPPGAPGVERARQALQLGLSHEHDRERLDQQQGEGQAAGARAQRALGVPGQDREVERQQERDRRRHRAVGRSRPGVGEGRERALRGEEQHERQDGLQPVEAPAEQDARAEDDPRIDGDERLERAAERVHLQGHGGSEEQQAAGQGVREELVQLTAAGTGTVPSPTS
ncbi:MAG: hypothetical protein A3D33_07525 [Candidatus Rokubacteria bacterium RIFCSPHIGHO2_02_FULL_73_26]|nr:MAG: hypothetical protein A3D33_07525 [Candidatus Rokubacteria bacterium RIFCSPHIGHO2_02_FULL_73_26]